MDALIMQASLREVDVAGEIAEATELRVREAGGGDHFYGAWSGGSEKSGGHPMAGSHPSGGGGGLSVEDMLRNINTSGDPFSSTPAPARDGLQSAIKSAAGGSGTLKVVRNADGTATMTGAFPALKRGETKTITSGEYSITAHRPLIGSVRMTVGGVDQADVNRMEVGGFTRDGRYASQAKVREAAAAEPDAKEPVVHICVATVKAKPLKEASGGDHFYGAWAGGSEKAGGHPEGKPGKDGIYHGAAKGGGNGAENLGRPNSGGPGHGAERIAPSATPGTKTVFDANGNPTGVKAVTPSTAAATKPATAAAPTSMKAGEYTHPSGYKPSPVQGTVLGKPINNTVVSASGMGVEADEHFGGYRVDRGFNGLSQPISPGSRQMQAMEFRNGAYHPIGHPQWVVEMPGGKANADRIWQNRGAVDKVVAAHGGRARVGVTFNGNKMTVHEYDFGRWSDTVDI